MRLAILTSRYPNENDPYQHMFVHVRAKFFKYKGIDVEIFVPNKVNTSYTFEGIKVNMIPTSAIKKQLLTFDLSYLHLLNMYPIINNGGFSLYHFIKMNNIPYLFYCHGNEVYKYEVYNSDFKFQIKEMAKWLYKDTWGIKSLKYFIKNTTSKSNFIFPSNWLLQEAKKNLKVNLDHAKIVPNGIDTAFFKFQKKSVPLRNKILTIRSLDSKVYNIKMTIDIVNLLPDTFTLDIYGIGKYKEEYETYIQTLGLEHRIKIIEKFMNPSEMRDLYASYGIFISTTDVDSQGVTIQEAISSGLLGVVNRNSSKSEFYENKVNGIIGDQVELIAKDIVETVASDAYDALVTNARKWMEEQFDIHVVTEREYNLIMEFHKKNSDAYNI